MRIKFFLKLFLGFFSLVVIVLLFFLYAHLPLTIGPSNDSKTINDASSLNKTSIEKLISVKSEKDILDGIEFARKNQFRVSIAGKKHSMGGQAFYRGAVVLDMTNFDKVLSIDVNKKVVTVQSGASWNDLQSYLNTYGMAVIAMQGPNIFTIGGSLSVNAHGWDKNMPLVSDSVVSFRIILSDGSVRFCSSTNNPELFHLVLGGYGLFGVILDVTLRVTENITLKPKYTVSSYKNLIDHFETVTKSKRKIHLAYGDLSIAPESFLDEVIVSDFYQNEDDEIELNIPLAEEVYVKRDMLILNLSRKYEWGKSFRWYLTKKFQLSEEVLSRNNLMRSPFKRLNYYSSEDVDILQEYFIPVDRSLEFVDKLRKVILKHKKNLLNCTVRLVNKSSSAFLNYAKKDSYAFVLYFNVKKNEKGLVEDEQLTRELIDISLSLDGTFYLPYLPYYDLEQLRMAYPESRDFFMLKRKYDPNELFTNYFYQKYGRSML